MTTKPHTIDEYLAGVSPENRAALQKVRRAVNAAAPGAEECISYGMPAFRLNGQLIAGFQAAANHCSFHPMSGDTVATLEAELAGYDTSRGTIRFPARAGLPATLVRKLVRARIAEGRVAGKATKTSASKKTATKPAKVAKKAATTRTAVKPTLLSGGNPQIAKGDGDAPVQAYIAAMPGWKRAAGRRLDALIVRTVPGVRKAVKWNSPLYGVEGQGWFLSVHCFTKYIKVAFFRGASLHPVPPVESKDKHTRYFHIHEDDEIDEALVASWIRQASELPGWVT